ncbi:MAG: pitrilysin family protein [Patescibacteria group bacterium]|nr:insulinase family protein [Patescibacteria group bacterium]
MKLKKIILKNGMPAFLFKIPSSKSVTTLVMFKTGSKYENLKNSGLSHFLEHMFFKGTEKRPTTRDISGELDSIGAEFNAFTGKEYTGYYIKSQKAKVDIALDVLSDMLINSKFEQEEIDRERGVIVEELNMYEDNPLMHIEDVFESCLYGNTPAGWETIGFKKNILNLNRQDFLNYYNSQYGANGSAIFVAGNFSEEKIKKSLEKKFGNFKKNKYKNKIKVIEKQKTPNLKIKNKKTDQITLSLGFRAFPAGHKDERILKLLSVILGGSMSSRLFIGLRERRGLAYYVRSGVELYSDCGYISVQAGIPKNKLEESIKVILSEYKKLKNDLVSSEELKKAKDLFAGRLIVGMEGTDDFTNWYGHQFPFSNKFLSPDEVLKKVEKVSSKDIKRVANNLFMNNKLNLAIIGEGIKDSDVKKYLKI